MSSNAALVTHPDCIRHETGPAHLETPERLRALLAPVHLDSALQRVLCERLGTAATEEDLVRVHDPVHVRSVKSAVDDARQRAGLVWFATRQRAMGSASSTTSPSRSGGRSGSVAWRRSS